MDGRLYVISGPSGVGKSTIIHRVMEEVDGLGYSVSHTTRSPRKHEVDGRDYHFVDRKTFAEMIRQGDLLEWAEVYNDLYGTSFSSLHNQTGRGMDVIMDVDTQGARNVRKRIEDCILLFILPPSLDALEQRLRGRGTESEGSVRSRTDKALREIQEYLQYDYLIFNDDLPKAVDTLRSIIVSERSRTPRLASRVRDAFRIP